MKNRPLGERRLHITKGVLGTTKQGIGAPRLLGREIAAIGLEKISPVELLGGLIFRLESLMRQAPGLCVIADLIEAGDAWIAFLETADRFIDLVRFTQSAVGNVLA